LEELNLNDWAAIENLNSWDIHFRAVVNPRDVVIPALAKNWKMLTVAEVDAQVKSGNPSFCGKEGNGNHASIKIVDPKVRKYVFSIADNEKDEQSILDLDAIKKLLATTPESAFKKALEKAVVSEAEKRRLVTLAKDAGIEKAEVYKLRAIEKLTGVKIE
jgi:hypothetical protein